MKNKLPGILIIIIVLIISSYCRAEMPPKEDIPKNIPEDVRKQILRLYSPEYEERIGGLDALYGMEPEKAAAAIPYIVKLMFCDKTDWWNIRRRSATVLGHIGDKSVEEPLRKLHQTDPVPAVQRGAREGLAELRLRKVLPPTKYPSR